MANGRSLDFVSSKMSELLHSFVFEDQENDHESNKSPFEFRSLPEEGRQSSVHHEIPPSAFRSGPTWEALCTDGRVDSIHPYLRLAEFPFLQAPPNEIHEKNFVQPYSAFQIENVST